MWFSLTTNIHKRKLLIIIFTILNYILQTYNKSNIRYIYIYIFNHCYKTNSSLKIKIKNVAWTPNRIGLGLHIFIIFVKNINKSGKK